ncbi:MAG: acylneuraminate cytidylyltransferase [uncultured bacterium]|nr:MAG: acylneuraminate cytidylyltransferase [uncultured bacterium]
MHKHGAIIFSRMDSSRFPKKAFSLIGKKTVIEAVISRIIASAKYQTVIATSNRDIDDPLELIALKNGILCYRGESFNVAKRALDCAKYFDFERFARVNGDSPFVLKSLLDEGFIIAKKQNCDFLTNLMHRTYPYGISVEIIKTSTLEKSIAQFYNNENYEHVTDFFYKQPSLFHIEEFKLLNRNYSNLHWTIDTPGDLQRLIPLWNIIENKDINIYEMVQIYQELMG